MTEKSLLKPKQAKALKDLEDLIGENFPLVQKIEINFFGVKIEGDKVVGLGLYNRGLSTLPESIGNLTSLQTLDLGCNQLTILPETIGNLTSLTYLSLYNNPLSTLPESIGNLTSLQNLSLTSNQLTILPESIGNLTSLTYLSLYNNPLSTLPESIGNLSSLKDLRLQFTKFSTLPESIGNLTSLQKLFLSYNKLTTLPESIGNLSSLKDLDLQYNKLTTLPESLWKCKNLESLNLKNNAWEGEWKWIEEFATARVLELCRQREPITVFVSHSQEDQEQYRINDIAKNLIEHKEIRDAYIRGDDKISESQLLIFVATNNSINNEQCRQELRLALANDIGIIPIIGPNIDFSDLKHIDLSKDFNLDKKVGFEFDGENVEDFCDKLYDHIKKYKREVNLFEPTERKIDEQWENIKIIGEKLSESDEFRENINENLEKFKKLSEELKNDQISPFEYIFKCAQILDSKSK